VKGYGIKLIVLGLLSIVTMDAYATDIFAGVYSDALAVFWDNKLYIPLGLIVASVYFRLGR